MSFATERISALAEVVKETFCNNFVIAKCFPNDTNPPVAFGAFR